MRIALLAALVAGAACADSSSYGSPARLVVGASVTVIVNSLRPMQLTARVLDTGGRVVPGSRVHYELQSGAPLRLSATGVATCVRSGDAVVRAVSGALVAPVVVRCRPVDRVRSMRMLNLLAGGPPQELPFEAVDSAGRPVALLAGYVTIRDSGTARVQGTRVAGITSGTTSLDIRIGERTAHASVHVYALAETFDSIQPGQHLAVSVRLASGAARAWQLPAGREPYFITVIRHGDERPTFRMTVIGANCSPGLDAVSYFCSAREGARVVTSSPLAAQSAEQVSGALAVWRQDEP